MIQSIRTAKSKWQCVYSLEFTSRKWEVFDVFRIQFGIEAIFRTTATRRHYSIDDARSKQIYLLRTAKMTVTECQHHTNG